jgi:Rrf2 family protein
LQVSAKTDYALRAAAELAKAASEGSGPLKGEKISDAQGIPKKFMENILHDLKRAGLVRTQRGASGGYWLALPPDEIWLAGIIRAVEGPLANVRGEWPEAVEYTGAAEHLKDVWIAVRASMRTVLESVTLADLVNGELPRPDRPTDERPRSVGAPLAGQGFRSQIERGLLGVCRRISAKHLQPYPDEFVFRYDNKT